MSAQWYVRRGDEEKKGPFAAADLRSAAAHGKLLPEDLLWKEGLTDWVPALRVNGLFAPTVSSAAIPPALPPAATVPPALPPHVSPNAEPPTTARVDIRTHLTRSAIDKLFASQLPSLATGSSSLIAGGNIPATKLDGARQYCDHASETTVRVLFDSTVFGTASEGFVILDNGIAWRNPGSNRNGWRPFDTLNPTALGFEIESGILGTKHLVLGLGGDNRIKCGALDAPTLDRLTILLAKAAQISLGTHPELLQAEARLAVGSSDFTTAATKWAKAADDPDASAVEIIDEVRDAVEKHGAPEPLQQLLADLNTKSADRSKTWSLKRQNCRFSEFVTASELADLWSNGQLFHDDCVRHFADPDWHSAADAEPVARLPRAYFRDTGPYDRERFDAVVASVRTLMGDSVPLFLGPIHSDDVEGLHIGVFDNDVVRIVSGTKGEMAIDRVPVAQASVRVDNAKNNNRSATSGQLRFGATCYGISIPLGPGFVVLREAWKRVALDSAKQSAASHRLYEAQRTLADAFVEEEKDEAVTTLRQVCKPFVEALADYHGGHPSITEEARGVLRFDEKGMEFIPTALNASGYMRIPYAAILEVAPPVIGELPEELRSSHASQQAAGAAMSIAAAFLVGGQASRAVGRSMRPDQSAVKPPKNRLGVSIRFEGTTYKLFFDVAGADRDGIEKAAKEFWAATAAVRGRFGKQIGEARPPGRNVPPGDIAHAATTSTELRDLLMLCLELQLTEDVSERLIGSGRFTAQQIEQRRNAAIEKLGAVLSAANRGNSDPTVPPAPPVGHQKPDDGVTTAAGVPQPLPPHEMAAKLSSRISSATAAAIGVGVGALAAGVASAAMASGRNRKGTGDDGSNDGFLMDLDHNGRADAVGLDTDGDGDIDAIGIDRDGDGAIDAVGLDTDNDGRIDAVGVDADRDGDIDAVAIDLDADGHADAMAMDTNDDGVADVAVLDDDGDGDIDAVAIDNEHDGEFDEIAVDGDEHESLETSNDHDGQVQDVDDEDSDGDLGDEADYDFEV